MIGPSASTAQSQPDPTCSLDPGEVVVLLDPLGNAIGTAPKLASHTAETPLHLAFSCYVFNDDGQLLLSQRAHDKLVFPGVWTNSVCGHPAPGEGLAKAVRRRASFELGLELADVRLILADFGYRAEMDGIVENELCPVLVARSVGESHPNAIEVADIEWVAWPAFVQSVLDGTRAVSPWCRMQVEELSAVGPDPMAWPDGDPAALPAALPPW